MTKTYYKTINFPTKTDTSIHKVISLQISKKPTTDEYLTPDSIVFTYAPLNVIRLRTFFSCVCVCVYIDTLCNCLIRVAQHTGWGSVFDLGRCDVQKIKNLSTFEGTCTTHIVWISLFQDYKSIDKLHLLKAQYICTCAKCKDSKFIEVRIYVRYIKVCNTHFISIRIFSWAQGIFHFICMEWSQFCWKRELWFLLKNKN